MQMKHSLQPAYAAATKGARAMPWLRDDHELCEKATVQYTAGHQPGPDPAHYRPRCLEVGPGWGRAGAHPIRQGKIPEQSDTAGLLRIHPRLRLRGLCRSEGNSRARAVVALAHHTWHFTMATGIRALPPNAIATRRSCRYSSGPQEPQGNLHPPPQSTLVPTAATARCYL